MGSVCFQPTLDVKLVGSTRLARPYTCLVELTPRLTRVDSLAQKPTCDSLTWECGL